MYYLSLTILTWLIGPFVLDHTALPRLLPYGFVGAFLNGFMDRLGELTGWWTYQDSWPVQQNTAISVLIHFGAAPLVAMLFAQGLRPGLRLPWLHDLARLNRGTPWVYIAAFSLISLAPEVLAAHIGRIVYGGPWSPYISFVVYVVMWWSIYRLDHWWQREHVC